MLELLKVQILFQCRTVVVEHDRLQRTLVARDVHHETGFDAWKQRDQARIRAFFEAPAFFEPWCAIQAMLTAAANAKKGLWGVAGNTKAAAEREPLRQALAVPDESPLKNVDHRNRWDHFDEKIDHWWKHSRAKNYVDMSFVDQKVPESAGMADEDTFRAYSRVTGEVVFWGDRFNLHELAHEAERIATNAPPGF
ncbi:MAG TPA: hypothetical protein VGF17_24465 [Phytomonospora sp.]